MRYSWFKLHHDLPDDIKLRRFTPQEKWAWVALLCLASKSAVRGIILAEDGDIADYCEFNCTQDWLYYRDKLIAKGMLEINPNGNLQIVHWGDRQHGKPSDRPEAIKKRVSAYRSRKKTQKETPCNALHQKSNADVTPQIREEEIREDLDLSYKPIDLSASCESDAQVSTIQGSERLPKRATEAFFSRIVATYNDRKPRNWANCTKCNDNRLKLLNRLIEVSESYEDANQWVIDALEYVSSDPWWKELKGEFEKLFRDSRFVQFAEKARQARVEDSSSPEAVQAAISKELKRLAINGILPNEWQQKTGVAAISDLGAQDAIAYLTYLRGISDATAAAR